MKHYRPHPRYSTQSYESGIYLIAVAGLIVTLFIALTGLGLTTVRTRYKAVEFRMHAERICRAAAENAYSQADSLRAFSSRVKSLKSELIGSGSQDEPQSGITITKALLIAPTMRDSRRDLNPPIGGGSFLPQSGSAGICYDSLALGGGDRSTNLADFLGAVPLDAYKLNYADIFPDGGCDIGFAGSTTDCVYQYSLCDTGGTPDVPSVFHDNVFTPGHDPGSIVACDFEAVVKLPFTENLPRFFRGGQSYQLDQRIRLRVTTAWRSTVPAPLKFDENHVLETTPGLMVLIAPHMPARSNDTDSTDPEPSPVYNDNRFEFPSVGNEVNLSYYTGGSLSTTAYSADPALLDRYDPLYEYNLQGGGASLDQNGVTAFLGSNPEGTLFKSVGGTYDYRLKEIPPVEGGWGGTGDPDERRNLLAGCANPAVLVRNLFLTTIMELASRNGQLRSSTELLLVNSQHQAFVTTGGLGLHPNYPTRMVPFGSDLAVDHVTSDQSSYQLPFTNVALDPTSNIFEAGFLNPLSKSTGTDYPLSEKKAIHHRMLLGQLRHCYHLYQGAIKKGAVHYDVGLERAGRNTGLDYFVESPFLMGVGNSGFENPDRYAFSQMLWGARRDPTEEPLGLSWSDLYGFDIVDNFNPDVVKDSWEQNYPIPGCSNCPDPALLKTRGLTASELVSSIGTIQSCPGEAPEDDLGGSPPTAFCTKPGALSSWGETEHKQDLLPDLRAAMAYVSGADQYALPDGSGATVPVLAYESPGFFPYETDGGVGPADWVDLSATPSALQMIKPYREDLVYGSEPYKENPGGSAVDSKNSIILIVTHKRLLDDEADEIRSIMNTPAMLNRRVLVVFIPTTGYDANGIDEMADAFRDTRLYPNSQNAVMMLSPFEERYDDNILGGYTEPDYPYPVWDFDGSVVPPLPAPTESELFRGYWYHILTGATDDNIVKIALDFYKQKIVDMKVFY